MKKEQNLSSNKKINEYQVVKQIESISKYLINKKGCEPEYVNNTKTIIIDRVKKNWNKGTKNGFQFGDFGWFRAVILEENSSSDIDLPNEFAKNVMGFRLLSDGLKPVASKMIGYFVKNLKGLPKDIIYNLDLSYTRINRISSEDLPKIIRGCLTIANCNNLKEIEMRQQKEYGYFSRLKIINFFNKHDNKEEYGYVSRLKITNCNKLENIKLPGRVGSSYISDCNNLLSIDFVNTKIIDNLSSFKIERCARIGEIKNLNDNVLNTSFDEISFSDCRNLKIRKLPKSVNDFSVEGKIGLVDGTEMKNVDIKKACFIRCKGPLEKLYFNVKTSLRFLDCKGSIDTRGVSCNDTIKFDSCNGLIYAKGISFGCKCSFQDCKKLKEIEFSGDIKKCLDSIKLIIVEDCKKLKSILGKSSEINFVRIKNCNKLNNISNDISLVKKEGHGTDVTIESCNNIKYLPSNFFKNSNSIQISKCGILKIPKDISENKNLQYIEICCCKNLIEIAKLPCNLKNITISGCRSITYLDLTGCKNYNLREIKLRDNTNLVYINGISNIDNNKFYEEYCDDGYDLCNTIHNENINLINNEYVGRDNAI